MNCSWLGIENTYSNTACVYVVGRECPSGRGGSVYLVMVGVWVSLYGHGSSHSEALWSRVCIIHSVTLAHVCILALPLPHTHTRHTHTHMSHTHTHTYTHTYIHTHTHTHLLNWILWLLFAFPVIQFLYFSCSECYLSCSPLGIAIHAQWAGTVWS